MPSIRHDNLLELFRSYIRNLNIGQIILGICIVALSIYCGINVVLIFKKYLRYETIISLENNPPNSTDFPGITICAPSIMKPQVLAHYYPAFAKEFYTYDYLKRTSTNQSFDLSRTNTAMRNDLLRKFESKALSDFSAEQIIKNMSVRPSELLTSCVYNPINIRSFQILKKENQNFAINSKKCEEFKDVQEIIFENRKCFTYFSDLAKEKEGDKEYIDQRLDTTGIDCKPPHFCEKPKWSKEFQHLLKGTYNQMVYDLNPSIEIILKSIENDIWHAYVTEPITLTVHPSKSLLNRRDSVFFGIIRSNYHEIVFTRKTTHLLKPPSKTMCVDYLKNPDFVQNEIMTRDQCINRCINRYKIEGTTTCANYYSVITSRMASESNNKQKICDHEHQSYNDFLEARNHCESGNECPAECLNSIFEVADQLHNTLQEKCTDWPKLPSTVTSEYDFADIAANIVAGSTEVGEDEEVEFSKANMSIVDPKLANYLPLREWGQSIESCIRWPHNAAYNSSGIDYQSIENNPARCNARVVIRISPKPFTTVRHQMAMTFESF